MTATTALTPEQRRDARLQATYGISETTFLALMATQGGVCAICARPPQHGTVLVVDHNHENGQVRGLLCEACNTGIGLLGDDPVRLRAAEHYLELHGHYVHEEAVEGVGVPAVEQSHPDLEQAGGKHE